MTILETMVMTIRSGTDVSTTIIHDSGPRNDGLSIMTLRSKTVVTTMRILSGFCGAGGGEFRLAVWDLRV